MPRTYGQYCALAKALDHVGDRWTLLVVRELLVAPRRYSDLRRALPRIATNLLADRLQEMESDGIIERGNGVYALTDFGRELERAVNELVRWGGRWMLERNKRDYFRPEWLVVALRALLPSRRTGTVQLEVEGGSIQLARSRIEVGRLDEPDATVEGAADQVLGVVTGYLPLSHLRVDGDEHLVAKVLRSR